MKLQDIDKKHRELMGMIEFDCWICQSRQGLQVAHIISRSHLSTRWDFEPFGNCHMLCSKCHEHQHNHDPEFYKRMYIRRTADGSYDYLMFRANKKFDTGLDEVMAVLDREIAQLKGDGSGNIETA